MKANNLEWFKDRVGKRIFRTESTCTCEVCKKVYEVGLIVVDMFHAQYLYDCQNSLGLFYFDKTETDENSSRVYSN